MLLMTVTMLAMSMIPAATTAVMTFTMAVVHVNVLLVTMLLVTVTMLAMSMIPAATTSIMAFAVAIVGMSVTMLLVTMLLVTVTMLLVTVIFAAAAVSIMSMPIMSMPVVSMPFMSMPMAVLIMTVAMAVDDIVSICVVRMPMFLPLLGDNLRGHRFLHVLLRDLGEWLGYFIFAKASLDKSLRARVAVGTPNATLHDLLRPFFHLAFGGHRFTDCGARPSTTKSAR